MKKRNRKIVINLLAVLSLVIIAFVFHLIAREIHDEITGRFLNFLRTSIYIGLLSAWGVSVYRRIVQPQVRRYLIFVTVLLTAWVFLRELKFRFVIDPDVERYMWYSYYIPILLTPLIALFVSVTLGKSEGYKLPKAYYLLYIPALVLIILVLTNDMHQLMFRFPENAEVWTEHGEYSYGILFTLSYVWALICSVASMLIMILKSHLPRLKKYVWLPFIPIIIGTVYMLAYNVPIPFIGHLDDMTVSYILIFLSFYEICIQLGLIPSNTLYFDLFGALKDMSLQIVDKSYAVCYETSETVNADKEQIVRAGKEALVTADGKRMKVQKIRGGYAVQTDDISELLEQTEALKDLQAELQDRSEIVALEYKEEKERKTVEEQTRLLDLMQSATQSQIDMVKRLTERYRASENEKEKKEIISRIVVLGSFIKRRKDFLLSTESSPELKEGTLSSALNESFRSLHLLNIEGSYSVHTGSEYVDGHALTLCYDFFEDVLECVIDSVGYLNVTVSGTKPGIRCTVMTDGLCEADQLKDKYINMRISTDEDSTYFILEIGEGAGK
ncbi:MAG: hypothetical protein K5761_02775 [Clostridiales bacterium]|nr:hypothetical protein [Clostridiales bacterium]